MKWHTYIEIDIDMIFYMYYHTNIIFSAIQRDRGRESEQRGSVRGERNGYIFTNNLIMQIYKYDI